MVDQQLRSIAERIQEKKACIVDKENRTYDLSELHNQNQELDNQCEKLQETVDNTLEEQRQLQAAVGKSRPFSLTVQRQPARDTKEHPQIHGAQAASIRFANCHTEGG